MGKGFICSCLVVVLLFGFIFSNVTYADSLPLFYNIDLSKAYYEMNDEEIEAVVGEYSSGNEFAKLVSNKLVNYNDYRTEVIKVIIEGLDLSREELLLKLSLELPGIIAKLPAVTMDSGETHVLRVIDIY